MKNDSDAIAYVAFGLMLFGMAEGILCFTGAQSGGAVLVAAILSALVAGTMYRNDGHV